MEKNRKHKDEYSIRTLTYYQCQGGIYNELITILQRIRSSRDGNALLAPNKLLNKASFMFDYIVLFCKEPITGEIDKVAFQEEISEFIQFQTKYEYENKDYSKKNKEVILCILCVLLSRIEPAQPLFNSYIKSLIDDRIYNYFKEAINDKGIPVPNKEIEDLKAQLDLKEDLIKKKDEDLVHLSNQVAEQQKTILELRQKLTTIKHEKGKISRFDKRLTLDTILEWIKSRQHYQYTEHVFRMLSDLRYRVATDEECDKIKAVEDEMLSKNVGNNIINNNIGMGSNFITGVSHHPLMPIGVTPEELFSKFIEYMNHGTREGNQDREP